VGNDGEGSPAGDLALQTVVRIGHARGRF
jgi:hypothetical protein